MLAGVATRGHVDVAVPLGAEIEAKATGRSSVSRRFKRATESALAELMARDPSGMDVAVIMDRRAGDRRPRAVCNISISGVSTLRRRTHLCGCDPVMDGRH